MPVRLVETRHGAALPDEPPPRCVRRWSVPEV